MVSGLHLDCAFSVRKPLSASHYIQTFIHVHIHMLMVVCNTAATAALGHSDRSDAAVHRCHCSL